MASGDNIYNNSSNRCIAQPGYWCPSQYASPFPNQSIWQGTLRPETWSEQEALYYLPHSPTSCSETSDSSSTASTTKRKRNTWSTAEEEILLNLCGEHKSGLKGSGSWQQNIQPRSQGTLSTSRKYPGYGWSRVYASKPKPHRGWVLNLILSTLSREVKVALLYRRYFESEASLIFVRDPA